MKITDILEDDDNVIPFKRKQDLIKAPAPTTVDDGPIDPNFGKAHPREGIPNLQTIRSVTGKQLAQIKQRRRDQGTLDKNIFDYSQRLETSDLEHLTGYRQWVDGIYNNWDAKSHPVNRNGIEQQTALDMDGNDEGDVIGEFDFIRNVGWFIRTDGLD